MKKKVSKKKVSKKAPTDGEVSVVSTSGNSGLDAVSKALESATTDKPKSKKSPKYYLDEPRKGIIAEVRKAYQVIKDAKATFEALSSEVRDLVLPFYRKTLAGGAEFVNTVQVADGDEAIQVQFKHAYSKIPKDQSGSLKEVVGNKYDDFFKETANIQVKTEIVNNPRLLEELVSKMGPDFAKYFTVEQFIVPTEAFTETRFGKLTTDQNAQLDSLVKQYSPSVKVR